jgi:hypothetical protein
MLSGPVTLLSDIGDAPLIFGNSIEHWGNVLLLAAGFIPAKLTR